MVSDHEAPLYLPGRTNTVYRENSTETIGPVVPEWKTSWNCFIATMPVSREPRGKHSSESVGFDRNGVCTIVTVGAGAEKCREDGH